MTRTQVYRRVSSVLAFVAVVALLAAGLATAAFSQSAPVRITQPIDENNLVTLSRNTRPEANAKNDRGPLPDGYSVDHILLVLQRSPQQESAVEAFVDSLNNRQSSNFHHWLTAEEFGERFGVSQQDIDTLRGWLESHGFHVNQVYTSHMMLDVSANAGQLRQAFHTSIHSLEVDGEAHIANMSDPMIPTALAPVVKGFFSLHGFKPNKMPSQ
jgi:subtilase family serine protease